MKLLLLLAAVIISVTANAIDHPEDEVDWIDYRLAEEYSSAYTSPAPVVCERPGPVCGDCKTVYLCTNITGEWVAEEVDTCEGDDTCNNGKCGNVPTPECALAGTNFECVSLEGVYPDPQFCTTYHYCVPDGSGGLMTVKSNCGDKPKYSYNHRTTICDIPIKEPCPSIVPICTRNLQTGALKDSPSMFYICKPYRKSSNILYPFLNRCPNGRPYDGNFNCK